jgi:hypothetical protein
MIVTSIVTASIAGAAVPQEKPNDVKAAMAQFAVLAPKGNVDLGKAHPKAQEDLLSGANLCCDDNGCNCEGNCCNQKKDPTK